MTKHLPIRRRKRVAPQCYSALDVLKMIEGFLLSVEAEPFTLHGWPERVKGATWPDYPCNLFTMVDKFYTLRWGKSKTHGWCLMLDSNWTASRHTIGDLPEFVDSDPIGKATTVFLTSFAADDLEDRYGLQRAALDTLVNHDWVERGEERTDDEPNVAETDHEKVERNTK